MIIYTVYYSFLEIIMKKGPRNEALRFGKPTYNTGKPCTKGHISDRYTKSSGCVECVKTTATLYNKKIGIDIKERKIKIDSKTCEVFIFTTIKDYPVLKIILDNYIKNIDSEIDLNPINFKGKQVAPGVFQIKVRVPHDKVSEVLTMSKIMLDMSLGAIKPPDPIPTPDNYDRSTLTEDYSKI